MSKIQSVIFNKNMFTFNQAKQFVTKHNLKNGCVEITKNQYGLRQIKPSVFKRDGYNQITSQQITDGSKYIIYYYTFLW